MYNLHKFAYKVIYIYIYSISKQNKIQNLKYLFSITLHHILFLFLRKLRRQECVALTKLQFIFILNTP